MAIELLGAGNDRLDYGDMSSLAGVTGLTIALTIKPDAAPPLSERFISQWGSTDAKKAFLIAVPGSASAGDIGFVVSDGGTSGAGWKGKYTSTQPLNTAIHRIVCRWQASGNELDIWIGGASIGSLTDWFTATPAGLGNASTNVQIGHETDEAVDGVDGDYSEIAIYDHKVPDWFARAYGLGYTPEHYRKGGLLYARCLNNNDDRDRWGGNTVTNTGGTTAAHPSIIRPSAKTYSFPTAITNDRNVLAATEELLLTEYPATITSDLNVPATTEELLLTEYPATITSDLNVAATTEELLLTEYPATITSDLNVPATTEELLLTEYPATITNDRNVPATTEELILTEHSATIAGDRNVPATTEELLLTEYPATITSDLNVSATTEELLLTEYPATVTKDRDVLAGTESLLLTTYPAAIGVFIPLDELIATVGITRAVISQVAITETEAANAAITKERRYEVIL